MRNGDQSDISVILQAIDYVEEHLQEEISVGDMAQEVGYSLFHFSRVFSRVVRHTPYDYLMRRRLSEATRQLLESDEKIVEIAFDFQFNAPESFSRAFKRVYHVQPRQARQMGIDARLLMARPTREYLEFLNSGVRLKPTAESIPEQEVAGIASQIKDVSAVDEVERLWKRLGLELQAADMVRKKRSYLGLLMLPSAPSNPPMYLAGTKLEEGEEAPPSLLQKRLGPVETAAFRTVADRQGMPFVRRYAYSAWWPKANSGPLPSLEIERYEDWPASGQCQLLLPLPALSR